MEKLTQGLLGVGGVVGVLAILAARSRAAQAAENARGEGSAFTGTQTRPLPASLDAMTPDARAATLGVAQGQLSSFGINVTDNFSTLGASTRAAFDAWRAAHPSTGPGDIGVIASIDDAWRAAHNQPAVTTAPLGR